MKRLGYMVNYASFNPNAPCLVLAPHLKYPIDNGANILIDRRWAHFSKYIPYVDIIGEKTINQYMGGELVSRKRYTNAHRLKYRATAYTILNRSHYLLERFLTPQFIRVAANYLENPEYKTIVFSSIHAAIIIKRLNLNYLSKEDRLLLVETLNDEIAWFDNMLRTSKNPVVQLTAAISKRWVKRFLAIHQNDFIFIHLTNQDLEGYLVHYPEHYYIVIPAGGDIPEFHAQRFTNEMKIKLLFVGALNVKMNHDALLYFREKFYPILLDSLGDDLEVVVVGSRPSMKMYKLCAKMGWELYADVTDAKLSDIYRDSTFSLLPFPYTTGAKLKLINSLAHGLPFLATTNLVHQVDERLPACIFSDDPATWLSQIKITKERCISNEDRQLMVAFAKKYSWGNIARQMFDTLQELYYQRIPNPHALSC